MTLEEIKTELRNKVSGFAQKVAPLYVILNWQWSLGNTPPHIPSVDEIEKTLYELIEGLTEKYIGTGTGGLEAYCTQPDEEDCGHYGLCFTLEEEKSFD